MAPLKKKIPLYTDSEQIEQLKAASRFNAELMDRLRPMVKEGVTTAELDRFAYEYTMDHGNTPHAWGITVTPRQSVQASTKWCAMEFPMKRR